MILALGMQCQEAPGVFELSSLAELIVSESLTDDKSKTNVENDIKCPVSTYGLNVHWSPYTEADKHTLYTKGKKKK